MNTVAKPSTEREKKPRRTRDRLLEVAAQLFLEQGYEATGLAAILKAAGVNSGSLYYFFKSKEDLLVAVLDRYLELLHPCVLEPVYSRERDPIKRVFGILEGYREMLEMTECRQGCPIGNLALEMGEKSEPARERIALNFDNWCKAIRQCLTDAGQRLPEDLDRDQMATFILTVMEGGVMQARTHRSIEPFDTSVAMLRDYFERLLKDANSLKGDS